MIITRATEYWSICQRFCGMKSVEAKINFIAFVVEPAITCEKDALIKEQLLKIPDRVRLAKVG